MKLLSGTHGIGVFLAESLDAARTVLEAMWGLERNLLVQRYVAASAGRDLRLFVVGDRVVAAIRRSAPPGSFRSNLQSKPSPPEGAPPSPSINICRATAAGLR